MNKAMSFLVICTCFLASTNAQSIFQESYFQDAPYPPFDGFSGSKIATADIDGDGDLDLLLLGRDVSNVSQGPGNAFWSTELYTNDGRGNYTEVPHPFPFVNDSGNGHVEFGDVDGDGDEDVIFSGQENNLSGNVITELFLNDGLGNFTLSNPDLLGNDVIVLDFELADVDGDSDLDLLARGAAAFGQPPLSTKLYLNDGLGNFTYDQTNQFTFSSYGVHNLADIDGDNDLDLIVVGNTTEQLFINDGFGSFSLYQQSPFPEILYPRAEVADVDGDGDPDIILSGEESFFNGDNITELFLNDGLGNFSAVTGTSFLENRSHSFSFGDIEQDGDLDLVIKGGAGVINLYENDGFGNFEVTNLSILPDQGGSIPGVEFIDFNGSGYPDLFVVYPQEQYINNGFGEFNLFTGGPFFGNEKGNCILTDVNGDSKPDAFITGGATPSVAPNYSKLYINDGVGNFDLQVGTPFDTLDFNDAVLIDIDGDLDKDLVAMSSTNDIPLTTVYRNDGLGNFTEDVSILLEGLFLGSIATGDIDGDNDIDILLTGCTSVNWPVRSILYKNDGSGSFTEVVSSNITNVCEGACAFSDIDGDNDLDLIISGRKTLSTRTTELYSNDGSGNFTLISGTPFAAVKWSAIEFADIDDDSDQDLLITGNGDTNQKIAKLYRNNGTGSFSIMGNPFDEVEDGDIAFFDMDNDSDLDVIISGDHGSNTLVANLYKNQGNGIFNWVSSAPFQGVEHSSIAVADVNGDNTIDVLITGRNNEQKRVSRLHLNYFSYEITTVDTVCPGTLYEFPDSYSVVVNDSITHTSYLQTSAGLDSTITTTVYVADSLEIIVEHVLCDSVILTATGNFSNYDWSGGASNGQTFAFNPAGQYYNVTATYSGCQAIDSVYVEPLVSSSITYNSVFQGPDYVNQPLCFGGQITVQSNPSSLGLGWQLIGWNNGVQDGVPFIADTSLTYALYALHPESGCVDSLIAPVQILGLNIVAENEYCGGDGSAYVQITENIGSGSYYREWSTGEPLSLTNATAGYYTVEVTDINSGCQETAGVTIGPSPSSDEVFLTNLAFYDQPTVIGTPFENYFPNLPDTMIYNTTNPRNLINRGSLVRLKIECQNEQLNGQSIVGGECRIRSKSPWITVVDSVSNLNNVAWGARAWSVDEFEIFIEPFIVDTNWSGNQYTLDTIYDPNFSGFSGNDLKPLLEFLVVEGNNEWLTTCVPIPIEPLEVSFWDSQVDDDNNPDSSGDNDMIVEPSETIEYNPALRNISDLDAELVHGTFENLDDHSSISIWDNVSGVSGIVVSSSWWNYQFNQPQPILASSSTPMYPQFDFVFEYNDTATFQFDLHLVLGGGFKLFGSVDTALIMWSTPTTFNEGYPMIPTSGTNPSSVAETLKGSVLLYPNPTNGQFTIAGVAGDYSVEVYNNMGQLLLRQDAVQANTTLNLQQQAAGIYHVHVITNDEVSRFKLVKQ